MRRDYYAWSSPTLHRRMELLVFGHGGPPVFVFPTSMGSYFEYEDRGMVAALADKLEHGGLQLFCVQTVDSESFYAHRPPASASNGTCSGSIVSSMNSCHSPKQTSGYETFGATGCSFGAYHALTMALRHPDVFTSCVTMGGAFDLTRFLDGYFDHDAYSAEPAALSARPQRPWFLDRCRQNKWVLVTGERTSAGAPPSRPPRCSAKRASPTPSTSGATARTTTGQSGGKMAAAYRPLNLP